MLMVLNLIMQQYNKILNILLADDDRDDLHFFNLALKASAIKTDLTTVGDGEKLMDHLNAQSHKLPDVLFLDLNMPRKNGSECLIEIKNNDKIKQIPVIIYTTSLHEEVANQLYKTGAHYYLQKRDLNELEEALHYILKLITENKFIRPDKDKFLLKKI